MPRSKHFYVRKFLNTPGHHTVASVLASVDRGALVFTISDCDKVVKLDFNAYNATGRRNAVRKAKTLIEILIAFKSAMEQEFKENPQGRDY